MEDSLGLIGATVRLSHWQAWPVWVAATLPVLALGNPAQYSLPQMEALHGNGSEQKRAPLDGAAAPKVKPEWNLQTQCGRLRRPSTAKEGPRWPRPNSTILRRP